MCPNQRKRTPSAKRQAQYRRRHFEGADPNSWRLCVRVSICTRDQLDRLADIHRLTLRDMLERLINEANAEVDARAEAVKILIG